MNFGKIINKGGQTFVRDLSSNDLHHVEGHTDATLGAYVTYEIDVDDNAVDITLAGLALLEYGIQASTGSFYNERSDDDDASDVIEAEAFFGTCELSGIKGDIVPCLYLDTDGNVVRVEAGTWLVHSVLGKLAGAF